MYETILAGVIQGIEFIAAVMIVAAVAVAVWQLLSNVIRESVRRQAAIDVRLQIGQQLVLALEFLIAADILKTVLAPTLQDLGFLGGIILIRTVLSISIAYELRRSVERNSPAGNPAVKDESCSGKQAHART